MRLSLAGSLFACSLFAGAFLTACDVDPCGSTPEAFATRAERFFEEAAAADYAASDDAWELYDERLRELVEECYPRHEAELTREQSRAFWAGVGEYYVQRFGRAGAREALRKLEGGLREGIRGLDRWLDDNL